MITHPPSISSPKVGKARAQVKPELLRRGEVLQALNSPNPAERKLKKMESHSTSREIPDQRGACLEQVHLHVGER